MPRTTKKTRGPKKATTAARRQEILNGDWMLTPRERRRRELRSTWETSYDDIREALENMKTRIDDLGESVLDGDRADMLACFASNSVEGTLSLLRELRACVLGKGKP